jgi:hypothetical protein
MPEIVTGAGPEPTLKTEANTAPPPPRAPEAPPAPPSPAKSEPTKAEMNQQMDQLVASLVGTTPGAKPADAVPAKPAAVKPAATKKAAKVEATTKPSLTQSEVSALQTRLAALGYYSGSASGKLDAETIEAFNAWRGETGRAAVRTVGHADYRAFLVAISR